MDLILWRHADAGAPVLGDAEADFARPLSTKGERQARRMADWLNAVLPSSTRVLVSPALRAQQTAKALDRKFQTRELLGPGGSATALLTLARWPERREAVLVVGHQPALGQTAAWLMAGAVAGNHTEEELPAAAGSPWTIRKGAAWWLRHRDRQGVAEVILVSVRSPDNI